MSEAKSQLSISVIIPVGNGGEALRQCLAGVVGNVPSPAQIIVVADGSTDGSQGVAEEFGANVLALPVQRGPAAARNLGARAACGDILFFVDADVVLPPDAIAQVAGLFTEEPELAAVFGSYDDDPPQTNFLSQYKNLSHHYFHQRSCEDASTFFGACGAIRRDTFTAMRGFDENYRFPCVEDIELGYRLKEAGHKIRLCKALQVKHLKIWTAASLLKADFFRRSLPWTELILQHRRMADGPNLRLPSRVSVVAAYALPVSLIGAIWWPRLLVVAIVSGFTLLAINLPLYLLFLRRRGLWFALKAIPWNWFYYFYGGAGFAIGLVRFLFGRRRLSQIERR